MQKKNNWGTKHLHKSISAGGATALLGTAVAVALFATGTVAVELIPIVIAVAAIAAAALAVGGITYMMLKPSTKIDEVEEEQGITGDERKAWSELGLLDSSVSYFHDIIGALG